jgi:hypothetical protein
MPKLVVHGATLRCSQGTATASLIVPPADQTLDQGHASATIADFLPIVNVPPFGLCNSPSNPQVASATAAAQGVLTPQPCVPAISGPWSPGASQVDQVAKPLLTSNSTCQCTWAGIVSIELPASDVDIE